jgi:hypothetical protein
MESIYSDYSSLDGSIGLCFFLALEDRQAIRIASSRQLAYTPDRAPPHRTPRAYGMTDSPTCTPLTVWKRNKENGGGSRTIARSPTHDKELPVGRQSLQLYSLATPNGVKVTVMRGGGSNTTTGG